MSDARSSVMGGSYGDPADTSARIQFRRGLTLTAMTLLMPGSAQLVTGNRKIGRIAIRVWLALIAIAVITLLIAMTSRRGLFSLVTNPTLLTLITWGLVAMAAAWVALLVDAWRLGQPLAMERNHRLWTTGVNLVLCVALAGGLLYAANTVRAGGHALDTVFASKTVSEAHEGRYNVLLLGGDSGRGRTGLRPDSLNVASIDADTGRTVLIGLPRNLEQVPFKPGSVMDKQFPSGFNCEGCYLNAVNTWANDHANLFAKEFPGHEHPGLEVTKDAVEEITGLKINYYAMVNLAGFSRLIDAVGGVTINVQERTAIGGIGAPISGYIEAGEQKLQGREALWYARSRVQNDDFSRMGRQKCVMSAMLHQLSPKSVLFNAQEIAESSAEMLSTDIPRQDLARFMDLAIKAKGQKISSVSLVPPVIYTGNPDFPKVRKMIATAIDKAEGRSTGEKPTSGLSHAKLSVPDVATSGKDPKKANQSDDLAASC